MVSFAQRQMRQAPAQFSPHGDDQDAEEVLDGAADDAKVYQ
jgi:hypothetical protein